MVLEEMVARASSRRTNWAQPFLPELGDDFAFVGCQRKPLNFFLYEKASLFGLAAAYAAGIIKNHPFIDGNKRTGFIAAYTFLGRNGYQLVALEVDATLKTWGLASGKLSQEHYAEWIEANSERTARRRKQ